MLNVLWLGLMASSVLVAVLNGNLQAVVTAATDSAGTAFKLALGFTGVMALWLGVVNIAQESGLIGLISRVAAPVLRRLFPAIPAEHPAMAGMTMTLVANMLGLNNAATPLGIQAMKHLDELNSNKGTATDEMCMFLAINTSSVQLVPAGAIALLAAGGASDPTVILVPALIATSVSTAVGIASAVLLSKLRRFRLPPPARTTNDADS
jgi:spore maturation protein A